MNSPPVTFNLLDNNGRITPVWQQWLNQVSANIGNPMLENQSGVQDGSNLIFTLLFTPIGGTLSILQNGIRLNITTNYTINDKTISFIVAPINTDVIIASYTYQT
jgi:hypothetical protein